MAIERRAIFALSIAFTASIVAYPGLPPDMPPRAGVEGTFVGAAFVAFLLPIAAIAIWWILASLCRPAPDRVTRSMNAGAAAAAFLSTFHVVMLVGFIGGRPWVGRVLGIARFERSGARVPRSRAAVGQPCDDPRFVDRLKRMALRQL
jgi:hypothetical protein